MTSSSSSTHELSFVLAAFRDFYTDVIRVRWAVLADPWGLSARSAAGDTARAEARAFAARNVSQRLRAQLEKQAAEAGRLGGEFGSRVFRDAQYVMAGLADELFLHLDWEGRDAWRSNLIETQLFGSFIAGEEVFRRIDELLRTRDDLYRDLATVYLLALSLGFRGRYENAEHPDLIDYRRRLLAFVSRDRPSVLQEGGRHLFPQSHAHTLTDPPTIRLPYAGRWIGAVAAVLLLYVLAGAWVWRDVTAPLVDINDQIGEYVNALRVVERGGGVVER